MRSSGRCHCRGAERAHRALLLLAQVWSGLRCQCSCTNPHTASLMALT